MRAPALALVAFWVAGAASAQVVSSKVVDRGGSGPYPAIAASEASLPDYTVYRPRDLVAAARAEGALPVMVFGNGGCSNSSLTHERVLTQIASHGYIVIAMGALELAPGTRPHASTASTRLLDAMNWIGQQATNRESEYYQRVAVDRLAAGGQSCGGAQVLYVAGDPRVKTSLMFNSGIGDMTMAGASKQSLAALRSPIIYIVGGEPDVATRNAKLDYERITTVPVVLANLEGAGHMGTFGAEYGGSFARVALDWLDWQLKGREARAGAFLHSDASVYPGWTVSAKGFGSGIGAKRPVFGGACKLCPWGALGEVVRQAMQPYGYDVRLCYNCSGANAPLIVADRREPPPYRPDPSGSELLAPRNEPGLGPIDFGATAVQFMVGAYRGTGPYAREQPRRNLRLIANIQSPNYLVVAARAETGITDLSQVRAKRWPVKVLSGGSGVGLNDSILAYFGIPRDSILAAGGRIGATKADREDFDIIIHSSQGLTSAPEFDVWTDVSQRFRLNYIQLPDELLARIAADDFYDEALIPVGLLPGVERPVRTAVRTGTVVYTTDAVPDEFAYAVAKALDEQQQLLQWSQLNFSYNVRTAWKALEVPLHPGAERYYRERGYLE